ncbi:unnamed protein product [Rotaria magnacalcarata]|uniref:NADP-dependent oxidoreductase domain-containing protein n=2 Tax=Rotaria magnacalcarata TaxID=392030 RepID=A0A815SIQ4_9BILA|nr:unnamed protein product [Rotaria magnacalcarata]CAF1668566.1 unnamed protein product [Rotaria magnacalcarata]CAF3865684.1 unnamed protein product [Rotaria magnacalcarata]CAF3901393.1 unnamed protein product [Rotaria magnacalcarata]
MISKDNQKISVVEGMKKSGMPYVRLGNTGVQVSRICLGMMTYGSTTWREWVLEEQEARPFVKRALELGINFFDTADMYSLGVSEEITGRALNDMAIREEIVVATKVFHQMAEGPNRKGLSRKHIFEACEASLKRLNMDYIDLYQIHRFDKETPIEETMEALNDLVRSGKVRYIGASSMYAWQFAKAQHIAEKNGWTKFVTMQNHYNLVYREEEREMNPLCLDQGVGLIPWSPLARGFLTGNRTKTDLSKENNETSSATKRALTDAFGHQLYYADSDFEIVERLKIVAEKKQVKPAQLALAWILSKPGVCTPIIGASKMYQLEEAVAATSIKLSDEEIKTLEELYQPHRVLGHG